MTGGGEHPRGSWLVLSDAGVPAAESLTLSDVEGVVALDPGAVAWAQEHHLGFRTLADLVDAVERDRFRTVAEAAAEALVSCSASAAPEEMGHIIGLDRTSLAKWLSFALTLHSCLSRRLPGTRTPVLVATGASVGIPLGAGEGVFSGSTEALVERLFAGQDVRIVPGRKATTDGGVTDSSGSVSIRKRARRVRDLIAAFMFHSVRRISRDVVVAPVLHYEIRRHRHLWATLARDHPLRVIDIGGRQQRDRSTRMRLAVKHSRRFGHRFLWLPEHSEQPTSTGLFSDACRAGIEGLEDHCAALDAEEATIVRAAVSVLSGVLPSRWEGWFHEWMFWHSIWRRIRPRAVIGVRNGVMDVLPLMAASRSGIAAFSVGHGLAEHPADESMAPYNVDAVTAFVPVEDPRPVPFGFESCSGIYTKHEYEDSEGRSSDHEPPSHAGVTLVLCDSTALFEHGAMAATGALAQVAVAAERCADTVFALKEHPSERIWQTLCLQRGIPALRLENEMTDLFRLLEDASSVILLAGYRGSAAIHAVRSGLPVLRVRSECAIPRWDTEVRFWGPDLDARLPVATTAEEICSFVRSARAGASHGVSSSGEGPARSLSDRVRSLERQATSSATL